MRPSKLFLALAAIAALALAGWSGAAGADELRLDAATGAPVVEVRINGQPVRLIVDTRMPAIAAIEPEAATRLRLRRLPAVMSAVMELDGERALRGRVARPVVEFANRQSARVMTALFNAAVVDGADGLIGPGALPYDTIRIVLSDAPAGAATRAIELRQFGHWIWREEVSGEQARISFDLGRDETIVSRRLTRVYVERGLFVPTGDVRRTPFRLGVDMNAQAMIPGAGFSVSGFPPGRTLGHTDEALYPVGGMEDAIVVFGDRGDREPPSLFLGRSALAGCSELVASRGAARLTLFCQ